MYREAPGFRPGPCEPLSNFASNFSLRRYIKVGDKVGVGFMVDACLAGGVFRTNTRPTFNRRTSC